MISDPGLWSLLSYVGYFSTSLLVILCVMVIARAVIVPMDARRGAACGACGHEVTELAPGRCPECGAHLVRAGLVTRAMLLRHRCSLAAAILAWTVVVVTAASWAASMLTMAFYSASSGGTGKTQLTKTQEFAPLGPRQANRASRYSIEVKIDVILDRSTNVEFGTIEVSLIGPGQQTAVADVDAVTGACTILDPKGVTVASEPSFNDAAAAALYAAAGLDATTSPNDEEAAVLKQLIAGALLDPEQFESTLWQQRMSGQGGVGLPALDTRGGSSSTSPVMGGLAANGGGLVGAIALIGLTVYGAGCAAIVWLRRRVVSKLYASAPG